MASFMLLLLCAKEYPIAYISITAFVILQELHFLRHIDLNQEATSVLSLGVLEGKLFEESCAPNFNVCEYNNQRKKPSVWDTGTTGVLGGKGLGREGRSRRGKLYNYILIEILKFVEKNVKLYLWRKFRSSYTIFKNNAEKFFCQFLLTSGICAVTALEH